MSDEYALFLGCTIPTKEFGYEASTRKVFEALGIGLEDMEGYICCGYPAETPIAHDTWLAMAAYNIALAEEKGLDLVTPCNGCFSSLKKANIILKEDKAQSEKTNAELKKLGKKYNGTIEVKHIAEVLHENMEKINELVKNPLKDISVAPHTGCHIVKPSEYLQVDDPNDPKILDELVEITGAKSLDYIDKNMCCGNVLRGLDEEVSVAIAREKMKRVKEADADCMTTICPACHLQYDIGQLEIKSKLKEEYNIPVLHYPQLLGLAMGIAPEELGMDQLKVKANKVMEKGGIKQDGV
jgi:heterodisulfide reductase subunit B